MCRLSAAARSLAPPMCVLLPTLPPTADRAKKTPLPTDSRANDHCYPDQPRRAHRARCWPYATPFRMEIAVVTHEVLLRQADRSPNPVPQPPRKRSNERGSSSLNEDRLPGREQHHNGLTRILPGTTRIDRPKSAPHARYESPAAATPSIDRA
jgi:hypothetical protein